MSNAFSRSWEITKLSFHVIKQDKELLLFPLLAASKIISMKMFTVISYLLNSAGILVIYFLGSYLA